MSSSTVLYHIEDGIGQITLNRPEKANAMNMLLGKQLAAAIDAVCVADIGAVVLTSTGKQFCAGGDVEEFVERRADLGSLIRQMLDIMHPAIHRLATLPVPVLSAVQGPVSGAGISLALCGDIVLASPAMILRGGYSAIGLSPDLGASYYLVQCARNS